MRMPRKSFLIDINGVLYVDKEPVDGAAGTVDFSKSYHPVRYPS